MSVDKPNSGFWTPATDLDVTPTLRSTTPQIFVDPPVRDSISPSTTSSFFMAASDLDAAASGSFADRKGRDWDDIQLHEGMTIIGRGIDCDIIAAQQGISAKHASITNENGHYRLADCNSQAGTYVNGNRLSGSVYLHEKDKIGIGSNTYVFTNGKLIYSKGDDPAHRADMLRKVAPVSRPVILDADIKTRKVKNNSGSGWKELIRDIRLQVREGSLVALLGTAGAGKSTVMNCMNGMDVQGVEGRVLFRNVDLLRNFDQMKHLIGNVPQKKTFHPYFTPQEEFRQAAMLRLPEDTSRKEIKARVNKTLEMLSIAGVRKSQNCKLSGGEQTRVNIGIELVADRDLLCLDEPDQGLSPNYKHDLFQIMQDLAHKHCKTVISIIHDVSEIDMFDQVIMLAKAGGVGRLAFSGTPAAARNHFGVDIRDAYALLEREPERYIR